MFVQQDFDRALHALQYIYVDACSYISMASRGAVSPRCLCLTLWLAQRICRDVCYIERDIYRDIYIYIYPDADYLPMLEMRSKAKIYDTI
jgi:hypothetical protein